MKNNPDITATTYKRKALDKLLEGEFILIHINPQHPGVTLPDNLNSQPSVTLKISRRFRRPVQLTNDAVKADLLFDGVYFLCILPWNSVWGVTSDSNKLQVWPEAVPQSIAKQLEDSTNSSSSTHRHVIAPEEEKKSTSDESNKLLKKTVGGHLKRVK